jgi:hypothetical protein
MSLKQLLIMAISFLCLLLISIITPLSQVTAQNNNQPSIIFFSPSGDDKPIDVKIEVTFSEKMNQEVTKNAFSLQKEDGSLVVGDFGWDLENLTFTPTNNLEYETEYTVIITTDAENLVGVKLNSQYKWSFTTVAKKENDNGGESQDWWKTWEPIVTVLTIIGTAVAALVGYWSLRKKRSKLRNYIGKLDDVYNEHRKDPYVCEYKLNQLKEALKIKFKRAEMEENHYLILDKKIDDYLAQVRFRKTLTKPAIVSDVEEEIQSELKKKMKDDEPGQEEDMAEPTSEPELEPEPKLKDKKKENKQAKKPPRPRIIPD